MMSHPRVSVIIPFWNAGNFLREAVDSVIAQTFIHWELLLVDDGSNDQSTQLARAVAEMHPDRVRYLEHPGRENRGAAASRNLALRNAEAEFVALLDADDVWLPHKLADQVAILDAQPQCGVVCGRARYWYGWTARRRDIRRDFIPDLGFAGDMLYEPPQLAALAYPLGRGSSPCPSDLLIRRELLIHIGGFVEDFSGRYGLYEDQALLVKLYLESQVYVSNESWLKYRIHSNSVSTRTRRAGDYRQVRGYFLRWLAEYLQAHNIVDPEIEAAMQRAVWFQRHPIVGQMMSLSRRVRSRAIRLFRARPSLP